MAVHPGHHEAAVAAPGGGHALLVGPGLLQQPVGGGFDVLQFQLAPAVGDGVEEGMAEARGAVVVHRGHHPPLRGEQLVVPAVVPVVAGRGVRTAVDGVHHRVLLLRVEARRVEQPHLHRVAQGAGEPHLFVPPQVQLRPGSVSLKLSRRRGASPARCTWAWAGWSAASATLTSVPAALSKPCSVAAADDDFRPLVGQVEAPQVLAALLLGGQQQRAAVVFPQQRCFHRVVPLGAGHVPLAAAALPDGQLGRHGVLLALVAGQAGHAVAVGAVARCAEVPVGIAQDVLHLAALHV